MQKAIVFLSVLLASGWTLPLDEAIAISDDGALTDDVYNRTVRKEPIQRAAGTLSNISPYECQQANVTVQVNKLGITVTEWGSQQEENVSYKVAVTWLEQNRIERDFEIVLDTLLGYELPVKDSCTIISLVVCRKHVLTSECGCKEWMPPVPRFDQIQISPTDDWSYLLSWHADKVFCLHHYVISINNHPPTKIFDTNIAPVPLHNIRSCKPNIVRLEMFLVNGRSMCLSTEILIHTDRKSKTNTRACYASVDVTLNVNSCTHKNVPAEPQIVPKYTVSKSDATACAMSSVSEVMAYCNVTVDSDGSNMVTSTTVSSHRVHSKSNPNPSMRDVLNVKATSVRIPSSPPICPGRSGTTFQLTSREVIGPVRDLRAYTDLDRTVLLSWRPPKESHCVKEYVITWATESRTINASMSSYNVTNLEPCLAYEFTVNTIDNTNEKGTPESVTATVRELQQLSEVTELELYEVEPRSLSVKWKPPVNGTYCVQSYRVVAWYTHPNSAENGGNVLVFSNTTNDQHVTFGEVIACMTYTVQVIPISFSNSEGRNELGTLKTKERTILSYHVEPIRALTVKSRSLELSTMLHSENYNKCLMVSVRFNCSMLVEGDPDPASQVVKEFAIPNSNNSFEGIVEPLTPYSVYQCNAQIQNIAGWSDPTPSYEFQTAEDVPESPSVLQLVGSNRSIEIIWKAPAVKNGVVVRYRIHVRMVGPQYPLPKLCAPLEEFNETVDLRDEVNPDEARGWDGVEFQHSLAELNPYTMYTVQVVAATGAGFGPYTDPEEVVTLPDVSSTTTNFRIERIEVSGIDQPYRSAVHLAWELPCGLHGKLKRFVGLMQGVQQRDASKRHQLAWYVVVEEHDELLDAYRYVEDRLKPEYNYTVSLRVEVADVSELSPEDQLQFKSPAGGKHGNESVFSTMHRFPTSRNYGSEDSVFDTIVLISVVLVLGICLICVLWVCFSTLKTRRIKNTKQRLNFSYSYDGNELHRACIEQLPLQHDNPKGGMQESFARWEYPRQRLKVVNILGDGTFGHVLRCEATDIDGQEGVSMTAVKTLKENAGEVERGVLMAELQLLKSLEPHINVVRLLGCCIEKDPIFVIFEYVNMGKLQTFLRNSRPENHYRKSCAKAAILTWGDLTLFMLQIARGMEFLTSRGIIHRNLASRNILITQEFTCKVANFSFARNILTPNIYEQKGKGRLLIRWMAPETLFDNVFTVKSDVWSFGVLMWEIATFSALPYSEFSAVDVMRMVRDGYRLLRPDKCRRELYCIMLYCWMQDRQDRPDFSEVVAMLQTETHSKNGCIKKKVLHA